MSDNNHDDLSSENLAIDALLREHSHLEGTADTDFLANLDARLDEVDHNPPEATKDAETKTRSLPIFMAVGMAIAACLPAMLLIQGRFSSNEKDDYSGNAEVDPPELMARTSPVAANEAMTKKQGVQQSSGGSFASLDEVHDDMNSQSFREEPEFAAASDPIGRSSARSSEWFKSKKTEGSAAASMDGIVPREKGEAMEVGDETESRFLSRVQNGRLSEADRSPAKAKPASQSVAMDSERSDNLFADAEAPRSRGATLASPPAPLVASPAPAIAGEATVNGAAHFGLVTAETLETKLASALRFEGQVITPDSVDDLNFHGRIPRQTPARDSYGQLKDNVFKTAKQHPLSTFSIDVDTASYSNLRRMITSGQKVPADAVRIEEMINYFSYDYPQPEGEHPFAVDLEVGPSPWAEGNRIVRVGLKGVDVDEDARPSANLVFLLDVSGSMNSHNKLPLVKKAMSTLVEGMAGDDTVGIVVYAGREGIALPPTDGGRKSQILKAIQSLNSGGSTNGEAGIKLAYRLAQNQFVKGGINRVVLCTDGDFNAGTSSTDELVDLVKKKAKSGVFLSVCGFGSGNLNDAMLEKITNDGNGNYFYIDSAKEAEKVFCKDLAGTLITIAKDVKIQVEFNPAQVESYRLIGYANRMLRNRDFADDKIDAGDIGSGHNVTALYEITPKNARPNVPAGTTLRYQQDEEAGEAKAVVIAENASPDLLTVKLRYKKPDGKTSTLLEVPLSDGGAGLDETSNDFRHATAVAGFGMLLRDSEFAGDLDRDLVLELAKSAKGKDNDARRKEFLQLVRDAKL